MKKFYDIEIDSQVELENGKTLGKFEESKISVNDGNCGSGGWPSDLPKPSVGGYGYTEQGGQTTIVDNESITTVATIGANYGQFATPFDIVDGAYTVIFNGTEYNLNSTFEERIEGYYLGEVTESGYDFSRYPFMITNMGEGGTLLLTESAGDYEITVKMESETIHKIDERYLPSCGVMVVNISEDDSGNLLSDKTLQEIDNAYEKGCVIVAIYNEVAHNMLLASKGRFYAFSRITIGYSEPEYTYVPIVDTELRVYVIEGDSETLVSKNAIKYKLKKLEE